MTRIFCALALFMLGFGSHAIASTTGPFSPEYQLPDGTYASMCLPSEEHGTQHTDGNHCDTCIVSALHLFTPPSMVVFDHVPEARRDLVEPEQYTHSKRVLSHHAQSRGPPLNA